MIKIEKLAPKYWVQKIGSMQLAQKIQNQLEGNIIVYSPRQLREEFLINLKNFFLFTGNSFRVQVSENSSNVRLEMYIVVNIFGIFLFNNNSKDRPIRVIYYEEVVYAVGYAKDCDLFCVERDSNKENKFQIQVKNLRARELYEDIVSYCIMKTKENIR